MYLNMHEDNNLGSKLDDLDGTLDYPNKLNIMDHILNTSLLTQLCSVLDPALWYNSLYYT